MKRSTFVQRTGLLFVAISVPACAANQPNHPTQPKAQGASEANPLGPVVYPHVDSWLAIDRNGIVSIFFGKVELGTGVETSIAQLAADELYVPFSSVRVVAADTSRTPNQGYTAGSQTLTSGAIPVRQAAGTARAKLLALGARRLGVSEQQCGTRDGRVFVTAQPSRSVTYAALIGGNGFKEDVPKNPPSRPQTQYKISGTSVPRVDIPDKVYGNYTYVQDIRLPKMLHGRVIYPPGPGATIDNVDQSALSDLPERVRVVRIGDFLGVVAASEWHAIRAARALRVGWKNGPDLPAMTQLAAKVRSTPGKDRTLAQSGSSPSPAASGKAITATYQWPFQSHGSIGPSCAVADIRQGSATVWAPTQGVFPLRDAIAEMLGREQSAVRVIYVEGSGCYGQNGADDVAAAAALLSREAGAPVRVQYMRGDETGWDPKGPAMVMSYSGTLDNRRIAAWDSHIWTPTHSSRPDSRAGNLLPALLSGTAPAPVSFVGGDRDALVNYKIPSMHVVITDQQSAVLRQSALRGLGGTQNTFANESFMDELAHAAGADPLQFRLDHLDNDRQRATLDAVRPYFTKGRGLAWVHYENTQAIVAVVADVSVDRSSGAVRVNHLWIAHDCGMIVNPDGLRNQIEGNAIQASSRAVLEQVTFNTNAITSVDWNTYPILRFGEIPDVTIHLIDRREERILGAGEASTTVIAPAIANAIFAQTGARVRTVPFTPANVLAAMRESGKTAAPA